MISDDSPATGKYAVDFQWGIRIPLRDGVHLNATLYAPAQAAEPSPVIFTLTPYVGQTYHDYAMYFAAHGFRFLTVDVRGRANSEGDFKPNINEAADGHDVVEWLGRQPFCNGKVTMWGGSYAGYDQWATAKEAPRSLATIVPAASPYMGVDFPIRNNVAYSYLVQWLTYVAGRTLQDKIFGDHAYWRAKFKQWFVSGAPFRQLDAIVGHPSAIFQEWLAHPMRDAYWDGYNPSPEQYARLAIPVLSITGIYDGDQPGALTHFREHLRNRPAAREHHFLVIGPWDHAGTRMPAAEFCGLKLGEASLVDLRELHRQWYAWTLLGGPRPSFLRKQIAYYVMVAEGWRYADSLEEITARTESLFLNSDGNPTDVLSSGSLQRQSPPESSEPDFYVYDPRDCGLAELESTIDPDDVTDQRMVYAAAGKHLVYHSAPFEQDTEVSGFFKLSAWLSIHQPDTDFHVTLYDVGLNGTAVRLTVDWIRARHRESLRAEKLITTVAPLRYEFERFPFVSRLIKQGHRLRLVLGPINSIFSQKNYNSGGVVSDESVSVARTVNVRLYHDREHPSVLHVPLGKPDDASCGEGE